MHGPWRRAVDMDIRGYIDPAYGGEDGKRYLFLNGGGAYGCKR